MVKDKSQLGVPSKEILCAFIHGSDEPLNKRSLARFFGLKGQERVALKTVLRTLMDEGLIQKDNQKCYGPPNALPETGLVEIIGLDTDGELIAKPVQWSGKGKLPVIYIKDNLRSEKALSQGDQVFVRLKKMSATEYRARILKTLDDAAGQIIGIFKPYKDGGYVYPTDKKNKDDYFVPPEHMKGFEEGDLVVAEQLPPARGYGRNKKLVRIVKKLGKKDDPRLISLMAIHAHGIPTEFSKDVLDEAEAMVEPDLSGGRKDLREIPLITIDGADARDFDDAVFAEIDENPDNKDGWHLIVAIADVSFYVRPKSALDISAYERGNSTYFADRVVPMLPEKLSNDLCSLRPKVNRACLACHLWINKEGKLIGYRFERGLMRSAARLTYEEVEQAYKGDSPCEKTGPLMETVITPLYKAYNILKKAREQRGSLEIDLPERSALINDEGIVTAIVPRQRLESHQLIEEFMVLANVAAASALEDKSAPCLYRVHDAPSMDRLENTREFLKEMGYSLPKSDNIKAKNINHILKLSSDRGDKDLVHTLLLRTQSQAVYTADNLGHFGLALEKYAHFTSPIRRYADLIVHRSLVKSYKLGKGPLSEDEIEGIDEIATHISQTERRSMLAERDVMDRFTARFLSTKIGAEFKGRISSVTHFGLFVSLDETGADGIVPMRMLPRDYYVHDESRHALVGQDYGRVYTLSQNVTIRLIEADPLRGSTVFEMVDLFDVGELEEKKRTLKQQTRHRNGGGRNTGKRKTGPRGGEKPRKKTTPRHKRKK